MKFPSASRSAGLGTGEYDAGFETELSWAFERFTPFLNGGYRYLGSPPGFELNNVFVATVGGMYRVVDPLNLGLLLDYRGVASTSTGKRLELVPFASWKASTRWWVDIYAAAGLASGSADVGVGVQIGYAWSGFSLFTDRP